MAKVVSTAFGNPLKSNVRIFDKDSEAEDATELSKEPTIYIKGIVMDENYQAINHATFKSPRKQ